MSVTLRERQRIQVLADIRRAAYHLFAEKGYGAVTTAEIAAAAGISQRTLFRHVPTKEELVTGPLQEGGTAVVRHLEGRPDKEEADQALAAAIIVRTAAFAESDSEKWRRIITTTDLLPRATLITPHDRERVVTLTADRMRSGPDDDRPALLVHLAFAAADFGFHHWVHGTGTTGRTLVEHVSEALAAVRGPRWSRDWEPTPEASIHPPQEDQ